MSTYTMAIDVDGTMSAVNEVERRLIATWRANPRSSPVGVTTHPLDPIQLSLINTWRGYDRTPAAKPLWASALREGLAPRDGSAPANGLFADSRLLPDSPGRLYGLLLGGAAGETLARGDSDVERTTCVLFALEGILRAHAELRVSGACDPVTEVLAALRRWSISRGAPASQRDPRAGLLNDNRVHTGSGGDPVMLTALGRFAAGTRTPTPDGPANDADGAAAVPLGAVAALWGDSDASAYELGVRLASLTHGAPGARVPCGMLAVIVRSAMRGRGLTDGAAAALELSEEDVQRYEVRHAVWLGTNRPAERLPNRHNIEAARRGRTGSSTLAIALRAVLACPDDFRGAVSIAADHAGDTATSAMLCGQLMGVVNGPNVVEPELARSDIGAVTERMATATAAEFGPDPDGMPGRLTEYAPRPSETVGAHPPEVSATVRITASSSEGAASSDASEPNDSEPAAWQRRFKRAVLGAAIGEALGTAISGDTWEEIRERHGDEGLTDYVPAGHPSGRAGSETQLLLFTLEGLIRAGVARYAHANVDPTRHVQHAHQRWLHTQHLSWPRAAGEFLADAAAPDGWLVRERSLFHTRNPGRTMMRSLIAFAKGQQPIGTPERPVSDSDDGAALSRALPAALWTSRPDEVFDLGRRISALTHGNAATCLAAGTFAAICSELLNRGCEPAEAIDTGLGELTRNPGHESLTQRIAAARELAEHEPIPPDRINRELGDGWNSPEALGIGVYAALRAEGDFARGLRTAVNHSGNSAGCGAVCGALLAFAATDGIDQSWVFELELREPLERIARDAALEFGERPPRTPGWFDRYPPT